MASRLRRGWSERQIAADLGIGLTTVCRDVKAVREEWRNQYALTVDEWAKQETARYDAALAAIWSLVEDGQLDAIDRFVKLSVARRELLGLDAPKRVESKVEIREPVSPEELDGKIARIAAVLAAAGDTGGPNTGRA